MHSMSHGISSSILLPPALLLQPLTAYHNLVFYMNHARCSVPIYIDIDAYKISLLLAGNCSGQRIVRTLHPCNEDSLLFISGIHHDCMVAVAFVAAAVLLAAVALMLALIVAVPVV